MSVFAILIAIGLLLLLLAGATARRAHNTKWQKIKALVFSNGIHIAIVYLVLLGFIIYANYFSTGYRENRGTIYVRSSFGELLTLPIMLAVNLSYYFFSAALVFVLLDVLAVFIPVRNIYAFVIAEWLAVGLVWWLTGSKVFEEKGLIIIFCALLFSQLVRARMTRRIIR